MTYTDTEIIFQIISLIILAVTALFIILYWKETQRMKYQMIEQNTLSNKLVKSSNMPILDVIIETVRHNHLQAQSEYDLFLINKGNGSAFNISVQRNPSNTSGQAEFVRETPNAQIEEFKKDINIIAKDEKVLFKREHSNSCRNYTLKITFHDIFKNSYEWEYEGNKDKLVLKKY